MGTLPAMERIFVVIEDVLLVDLFFVGCHDSPRQDVATLRTAVGGPKHSGPLYEMGGLVTRMPVNSVKTGEMEAMRKGLRTKGRKKK
jgi:hypothetical protein